MHTPQPRNVTPSTPPTGDADDNVSLFSDAILQAEREGLVPRDQVPSARSQVDLFTDGTSSLPLFDAISDDGTLPPDEQPYSPSAAADPPFVTQYSPRVMDPSVHRPVPVRPTPEAALGAPQDSSVSPQVYHPTPLSQLEEGVHQHRGRRRHKRRREEAAPVQGPSRSKAPRRLIPVDVRHRTPPGGSVYDN